MKKIVLTAEIGINHNGDIGIAKRLIDVATAALFDYVKFQKRTIDLVYSQEELSKPRESPWGTTTRQQKFGLEFSIADYCELSRFCGDRGIGWFVSPWDVQAVESIDKHFNVDYMKVASACITDLTLLEAIRDTDIPVIISTGMSTKSEVDVCLGVLGENVEYILACVSSYPSWDNEQNLKFLQTLQNHYGGKYRIGFSNHSPGIMYAYAAAVLGAEMIEVHITMNRAMYGSDQAASIEPEGVMKLAKHVHNLQVAFGDGTWSINDREKAIREKLRRKS